MSFIIEPRGPFSLTAAGDFARGFTSGVGSHENVLGSRGTDSIVMAFPREGRGASAAAEVWQTDDGLVHVEFAGTSNVEAVRAHIERCLSLDHDGAGWPAVGERDPVIGRLQERYRDLRPVCFYSAYEAATSFVIGQRISMTHARLVKRRLADVAGDAVEIGGTTLHAFARPQGLLATREVQGLSTTKVDRLHGLARAALDGVLDTARLRALPQEEALAELAALPGVGPWTAQGVLFRGCGVADALPTADEVSRTAVQWAYDLPSLPDDASWARLSEAWRPYRMWATVLLHMAWRRAQPPDAGRRQKD
jgi:DNA-3-methyladenine glycosylase II